MVIAGVFLGKPLQPMLHLEHFNNNNNVYTAEGNQPVYNIIVSSCQGMGA